jgi:hypothetical protein
MSPVTLSRFLVKCFDYEEWAIIVEAASREDAIRWIRTTSRFAAESGLPFFHSNSGQIACRSSSSFFTMLGS